MHSVARVLLASVFALLFSTMARQLQAASDWTEYLHHVGPPTIGMTVDDARKAFGDPDAHLAFGDREPDDAACSLAR